MEKNKKVLRTGVIQARVSQEERQKFLDRCTRSGLSSADYIRVKVLEEPPLRAVKKVSIERTLVTKAMHDIIRIGVNLNQITRKLNRTHKAQRRTLQNIDQRLLDIDRTLFLYRKALGYDS